MSDRDSDSDFREPHLRRGDFLGAFGLLKQSGRILLVQNERVIAGRATRTWDLPGGQVEPGELLVEALHRELREEIQIEVVGETPFLFYQEGEKCQGGVRRYAWRSFFYAVGRWDGVPRATREVMDARWFAPEELPGMLDAPYHDSFRRWLEHGGHEFRSVWSED